MHPSNAPVEPNTTAPQRTTHTTRALLRQPLPLPLCNTRGTSSWPSGPEGAVNCAESPLCAATLLAATSVNLVRWLQGG